MLEAREITKSFGGTTALDSVSLTFQPGEVHSLVGQNGAGKSTLVKILAGALRPDSGGVRIDGSAVRIESPQHALRLGISIVHQHSGLVPELSVAENIFLGRLPQTRLGLTNRSRLNSNANDLLRRLDFDLDVRQEASRLDAAGRQVTEIARALSVSARVLILDEPSAVLGDAEVSRLFAMVRRLRAQGTSIVYVSHRLQEVLEISDRATVLKDGNVVGSYSIDDLPDPAFLVRKMVGREWVERKPRRSGVTGRELLRTDGLSRKRSFRDITFSLHSGEILGLAGLVGSGRNRLCQTLFGALSADSGQVLVRGSPVQLRSPGDALAQGIAYVSRDRHGDSLILPQSVTWNLTLPIVRRFTQRGVLNLAAEERFVDRLIDRMEIRCRGPRQAVAELSGGNQQKVVLARWLAEGAGVLLLDEPTIGVDIGAKSQIHDLITDVARRGSAVLLVSSEIPELLALCSRIMVMNKGRLAGEIPAEGCREDDILRLAT